MGNTEFKNARIAMVDGQIRPADVTHYNIIETMLAVPREVYFPEKLKSVAYLGDHIRIGHQRYCIEPRLLAKMLNLINVRKDELVMDIGSGFGYSSSILSNLAQAIVMVEQPEFSVEAEKLLVDQSIDNVIVKSGELCDGAVEYGPYDVVLIQGGVNTVPEELIKQIKPGGRIAAIFVNEMIGECRIGLKKGSDIYWRFGFNAIAPVLPGFFHKKPFKL
ncbi:MAG: protein-L-isoaspartate O-methyltransferase [Pseudomonadota bacterium]|nr:protein-L-isoaspartate O-methyltransferase [Pseudomonadota bacterium]